MIQRAPVAYLDDYFARQRTIREAPVAPPSGTDLRMQALTERIERAAKLRIDWDSYGAPGPSDGVIAWTRRALNLTLSLRALPATIVPSADGGLALCWDLGDKHAYIEFDNNGTAVVAMYRGVNEPIVRELIPADPWILVEIGHVQQFMRV